MTIHEPVSRSAGGRRQPSRAREGARKQDILAAAERLFSQDSYAAVSIRDIAAAADVNSALIRYHFGTKKDLYRSLFERRYHLITQKRVEALDALRVDHGQPNVPAIVECWVRPLIEFASDRKSRYFIDLLARETSDASRDRQGILTEYIDPSAKICIGRLRQALPGIDETILIHGYLWMIAAVMSTVTAAGRAQRLGSKKVKRPDSLLKPLVAFIVDGLVGIAGMTD